MFVLAIVRLFDAGEVVQGIPSASRTTLRWRERRSWKAKRASRCWCSRTALFAENFRRRLLENTGDGTSVGQPAAEGLAGRMANSLRSSKHLRRTERQTHGTTQR